MKNKTIISAIILFSFFINGKAFSQNHVTQLDTIPYADLITKSVIIAGEWRIRTNEYDAPIIIATYDTTVCIKCLRNINIQKRRTVKGTKIINNYY